MKCYIASITTPAGQVYAFRNMSKGPAMSMGSIPPNERTRVIEAAAATFDPQDLPDGALIGEVNNDGSEVTELNLYTEPLN